MSIKVGADYSGKDANGKAIKGRVVSYDQKSGKARVRTDRGITVAVDTKEVKKASAPSNNDDKTAAQKKAEAEKAEADKKAAADDKK